MTMTETFTTNWTRTSFVAVRQREVLTAIAEFVKQNRYAPSLRELKGLTGFSSISVVSGHIDRLTRAGLVRDHGGPRTLVVTPEGWRAAGITPPRLDDPL